MAIFDITASNTYKDYPLMIYTAHTTKLPKELLQGQSETTKTMKDIAQYGAMKAKQLVDLIV